VNLPRFKIGEINPRLGHENAGDAFQVFAYEVLLREFPRLHLFPTGGKDGAIDLSQTADDSRVICECKYVGADDLTVVQAEWRTVAKRLEQHLADPNGPTRGQSQYYPWYRRAPAIEKFVFCTSAQIKNQASADKLGDEIVEFFQTLSRRFPHLSHLSTLKVEVLDWSDFVKKTTEQPHLVFRWFPKTRPNGFTPLDDPAPDTSFGSYLRSENLSYYSRKDHIALNPPPTETAILDEDSLLARLETDDVSGLIITGRAGVGKTRLMLELGRRAIALGWIVMTVRRIERDALRQFAEQVGQDTRILLLFDYIEKREGFDDLIEELLSLNQTYCFRLRFLASCRPSHYQAVQKVERHERVNLSPPEGQSEQVWFHNYQKAIVQRVLEQSGLPVSEACVAVCHDTPVLAVFLAYLQKHGRKTDLAELLQERDFGQWLAGRLAHHSSEAMQELAKLAALFPLPHSVACSLKNTTHARLFQWLAQDGWIERDFDEDQSTQVWRTIHDVFADRILLSHASDLGTAGDVFFHELFRVAAEHQSLTSAIYSIQRVCDQSPLNVMNWPEIFAARIRDDTAAWRTARFTLLRSDILKPHERVWLLDRCKDLWAGAENELEFQNAIGWIIRRLAKDQDPPLNSELRSVLGLWIDRVSPIVDRANFFLTWALRYAPETARKPALQWIQNRPRLFQTHFLIVAWLKCGLPPSEIQEALVEWCRKHGNTFEFSFVGAAWLEAKASKGFIQSFVSQWLAENVKSPRAHFLLTAWLEQTGDTDAIRIILSEWLICNKSHPQAGRVLSAWLRAAGEKEYVADALAHWFLQHREARGAMHVYKVWLRAGGSRAILHLGLIQWLEAHKEHPMTWRALVRWMKSGGDTATIRSFLIAWTRNNATQKDADLVYRKWLAAGGDIPAVLQPVQAWLQKHQSEASARYMFSSWLESGGNAADIADSLKSWLTIHHKTLEACFVYPRWLEHTRQCDFIEPFIHSWIEINSTAFDARFVYETWLAAGGSREDVREPIRRWLAEHEKTSEARFVYDAWFDSTREVEFLRASLSRWLLLHDTQMESDHAMRSWLDAGGDKEIVRAHLANWLAIHRITSEASFVFQSWLKAGGDKTFVQPAIQDWLKQHSTHENARYVCTAWLDVGGEFDLAHDATLIRFQNHTADLDTQFEYRAWLEGGGSRQEVMPFLVRWLAVNQTALEARFVYKAWLEAGGDKNLMRLPVRAWLEKHGLTYEASFVYPAWLKAGGEVDLVAEFIEQWLKHHDTIEDASFIYEFWLVRGGDKSLVRPHIRSWLAMHSEIPQARFVYKTWLEAGGEFALIELSVLRWMEKNRANADSIFITRLIAREKHLSDQTLKRLVAWTGKMPEKDKCVSSFSQLGKHLLTPSLRNEIVVAAEQLLMPLLNNGLQLNGLVQGDTAIVISYLLDFSRGQTDAIRQRIDNLFLLWLRHPRALSFETKRCENIQRVEWLRRIGDLLESGHLNVERDRLFLERFLHWVDSWEGWRKSQHQTISAIESLKQRFPAPRLWSLVRLLPQFHQQSTRGKGYRYR
jgi:hypothetical protein